jgi:hypothetical protein
MAAAALLLLGAGCARTRPCLIIPMQLDLARHDRDELRSMVDSKQSEVNRTKENLDLSVTRLQQMQQEQDDLKKAIAQQAADSAAGVKK